MSVSSDTFLRSCKAGFVPPRLLLSGLLVSGMIVPASSVWSDQATHKIPATEEKLLLQSSESANASCTSLIQSGLAIWPTPSSTPDDATASATIIREPYTNPRGQQGTRIVAEMPTGFSIVWTGIGPKESFTAVQIETHFDNQGLSQWVFNGDCEALQHRVRLYNQDGHATALHVMNPSDGSIQRAEALNPPIPQVTSSTKGSNRLRVAMVDSGVNYTLTEINSRLARDESGAIVGYDFWEDDALPFDAHFGGSQFHVSRHGTGTASLLLAEADFVELVPYRYPRPDMKKMSALVEHAASNDVRIVGLPLGGNKKEQWESFSEAAEQYPDMLFIASAGNNGRNIDQQPVYPAALSLDNLLVVTSSNDFAVPAERVNWGRTHVDYMLPAEEQAILDFFGRPATASGSSYAVPRAVAMAARWLKDNPEWTATELKSEFARRFADGASARYVGGGYIADPLADGKLDVQLMGVQTLPRNDEGETGDSIPVQLPLSVFVLHDEWSIESVNNHLLEAERILAQCNVKLNSVTISQLSVPEYLRDLKTGPARTLVSALNNNSEFRPVKVFFARDTRMLNPFAGEAFGRANTRRRPWLQDSVWLTHGIRDAGIALAHELFHVLSNSGEHIDMRDNLMQTRTSPDNTALTEAQCMAAVGMGRQNALLFD